MFVDSKAKNDFAPAGDEVPLLPERMAGENRDSTNILLLTEQRNFLQLASCWHLEVGSVTAFADQLEEKGVVLVKDVHTTKHVK